MSGGGGVRGEGGVGGLVTPQPENPRLYRPSVVSSCLLIKVYGGWHLHGFHSAAILTRLIAPRVPSSQPFFAPHRINS